MAQAAANALQALRGQGMEPSNFEGVLVSITAPANLSMADFESVTDQIIGAISEDCNYQVALSKDLPDEGMQVVVFASEVL
jgi:cell division GTPase FtsZ